MMLKSPTTPVLIALTTLFAALAIVACGEDEPLAGVERDEPTLVIQPQRVDFPTTIAPGDQEEATITIVNQGVETLRVWNVDFPTANPNPTNFSKGSDWPNGEIELESMEGYQFSVIYNPTDGDSHRVLINMNSNDPDRPSASAMLDSQEYAN